MNETAPTPAPPCLEAAAVTREVRRVTWIGLVINVVLSVVKMVAGIVGSSQAIVADAVHSLSDTSTDVAVLVGSRYWSAPADEEHPHGHERIETLVAMLIGAALVAMAAGLCYNALRSLREQHAASPHWPALAAAILSIVCKEWLFRWTVAVGNRLRSMAVVANAWHHRSDAWSSIPAALAVGGAMINPAWGFLDHVGAVLVSLFIVQAAWRIVRPALEQLVDKGAPQADLAAIRAIVHDTDGVRGIHALRTRYLGSRMVVDLHLQVDGALSVHQGHAIAGKVKARLLREGPTVTEVMVHIEPYEEPDKSSAR